MALDACLSSLRYVSRDMPVESRDLNLRVDCLRALRDALKTKAAELGCPSERIDPLVDELDAILAKIRYVWSGDVIQPEDHNYVVDALKKARDILAEIESFCSGLKDQLDKCKADLEKCQSDLQVCQALIKPGYPVVPWDIRVGVVTPEVQKVVTDVRMGITTPEKQQVAWDVRVQVTEPENQAVNDFKFVLEYSIS